MISALRIAIVVIAALELYWFSDIFSLAFEILVDAFTLKWFDLASAISSGVLAPASAIAAGGFSLFGPRLRLAIVLLCVAPVFYMLPAIAFAIGIMIYGF